MWTPDGHHVWFTYDDGGISNVWAVAADGLSRPVAMTSYAEGQSASGAFWSKDSQTSCYQIDGELLAVSVKGCAPRTAWPSADRARVAFLVGGGNMIVHTSATNSDQRVANTDGNIGGVSSSPKGSEYRPVTNWTKQLLVPGNVHRIL